jgi:uncharacterized membrane protein YeiH
VDFDTTDLVLILDRAGIVAFALSGVEVGMRRHLDVLGLLVMGVVTSLGGGITRDILLGRIPLALDRPDYMLWALGAASVAILLFGTRRRVPRLILAVAAAGGLGVFATAGAFAALNAELPLTAVVILAMVTATGGGVIRDLLADRVPMVLRAEVNATAAGLGGVAVWALAPYSSGLALIAGILVTAGVRAASAAFNIHLPVPGGRPRFGSRAR